MHPATLALFLAISWPGHVSPVPAIIPSSSASTQQPFEDSFEVVLHASSYLPLFERFETPVRGMTDATPTSSPFTWASVSASQNIVDPRTRSDEPVPRDSTWATGETVKVPVYGDVFVFQSVDAGSESVEAQHLRWASKTGVGLRVDPWLLQPVQVRGGRTVSYDDSSRPPHATAPVPEYTELFIDVSTKLPVPVLGRPINVEYAGTTPPPAASTERPRLNQDVKLALPLADGNSKLSVGARLPREETPTQTPWVDRAQLYLGIELKR